MKLVITEAKEYRQSFETAAWYTIHIIQPGEYEIVDKGVGLYGNPYMTVEVSTIIKEDYKPSLFGGVAVGTFTDTKAGKESSIILSSGYYNFNKENDLKEYGNLVE